MIAISVERIKKNADGTEQVRAFICADKAPDTLPENGANVTGMSENQYFAPFSMLYVVGSENTKMYITDESGVFIAQ